jgi:hypothetical protein
MNQLLFFMVDKIMNTITKEIQPYVDVITEEEKAASFWKLFRSCIFWDDKAMRNSARLALEDYYEIFSFEELNAQA